MSKKFIVITSIFAPTKAVEKLAQKDGWHLIVVGDTKTPEHWQYPGVTYLSPKRQEELGYAITQHIPWRCYGRKILGYLYAIKAGAEIIADTDDDNIPYDNWPGALKFDGKFPTVDTGSFLNTYSFFTKKHIWPRGFPLELILDPKTQQFPEKVRKQKVGVWQFLADGDPDVDAIYRLTDNEPVTFEQKKGFVLEKGTLCPFNSQNTFFIQELFPLMYLPVHVEFRFTDILRGLIAQVLMWEYGYRLGFGSATVVQERNPHDYLKDFASEISCYLYAQKVVQIVKEALHPGTSLRENLLLAYQALSTERIVPEKEIPALKAWLENFK